MTTRHSDKFGSGALKSVVELLVELSLAIIFLGAIVVVLTAIYQLLFAIELWYAGILIVAGLIILTTFMARFVNR